MTRLIEECLSKIDTKDLYLFNFGLLDAPGPVYDGFLGNDSIISVRSAKEMIQMQENIPIDIITGNYIT